MGLFGSLFTGVSSLFAQSQNTAIIANNIANINTTGFKRSEATFNSLVTTEGRLSRYSPGTVSVSRTQKVDQQGSIQQTSSATDASISGNGFFPVKRSTEFGQEFLYTRAGQFSEDATGLMRNASGFVLFAWPIDANGDLPANQGDLTSLVPADVAFLGGLTRPTSTAELAINLNADEELIDPHSFTTAQNLPVTDQAAHFSRGLTVFDALGSSQTITMEFRKVIGPMAHFATDIGSVLSKDDNFVDPIGKTTGISAGDEFTIDVGGVLETYTFVASGSGDPSTNQIASVRDYIDALNLHGGNGLDTRLDSRGQLMVQAKNPSDTVTLVETVGTPISGFNTLSITPDPLDGDYIYMPDYDISSDVDTAGTGYDQDGFPDFSDTSKPNTQGWWEMTVVHPNGTAISTGLMNFDGSGTLNATADSNGNKDIELKGIDWGNGSSLQSLNIDVERFSQFAGNYDVIFSDQNGAELGLRTGIEITRDGTVVARFSNGASSDLYKIPLTTFANANGLAEVSGTSYAKTEGSGEENLREAGKGGAGFVEPSTLESSNVDLADEFAKLIVSQRAFGAGTRLISTIDQMTEELLRLR